MWRRELIRHREACFKCWRTLTRRANCAPYLSTDAIAFRLFNTILSFIYRVGVLASFADPQLESQTQAIRELPLPGAPSSLQYITAGPNGALWFTYAANRIGRLIHGGLHHGIQIAARREKLERFRG